MRNGASGRAQAPGSECGCPSSLACLNAEDPSEALSSVYLDNNRLQATTSRLWPATGPDARDPPVKAVAREFDRDLDPAALSQGWNGACLERRPPTDEAILSAPPRSKPCP
jgi:hypothetical protein